MSAVVMSGTTSPAEDAGRTRESLIKKYFEEGFEYRIILCFLYWVHGFILSLRHLKRLLKRMKLRRRKALDASSFRYINLLIRVRSKVTAFLLLCIHIYIITTERTVWIREYVGI